MTIWSAVIHYRFLLPRSGFSFAAIAVVPSSLFAQAIVDRRKKSGNEFPHSKWDIPLD